MVKINYIKNLRILKGFFFGISFVSFLILFVLTLMCFDPITINSTDWTLRIGSWDSINNIDSGNISFFINGYYCAFFVIASILLLISWFIAFLTRYYVSFAFNDKKLFPHSMILMSFLTLFLILSAVVIFYQPTPINYLSADINRHYYFNTILNYFVNSNFIYFTISTNGIVTISFFSIEAFILFFLFGYFSYKIIKKKYI